MKLEKIESHEPMRNEMIMNMKKRIRRFATSNFAEENKKSLMAITVEDPEENILEVGFEIKTNIPGEEINPGGQVTKSTIHQLNKAKKLQE